MTYMSSLLAERKLIKKAGRLAKYCAGYLQDLQDLESKSAKWEIFYAIDADIVGLYLHPSNPLHRRYAAVFDDGDTLLARLIGDFLLLEFSASGSPNDLGTLLIFPPHDDEISSMLLRITGNLMKRTAVAEKKLEDVLNQISDEPDNQRLANWAIENAKDLVMIFDGESGPALELSRFAELRDDRLVNIESYVGPAKDWAFPLPKMTNELRDLDPSYPALVDKWQVSLKQHQTRLQRPFAIDQDAYVLATLQWVNEKLEAEKKRVVLVTGTSSILKAANEDKHKIFSRIHHGKKFSEAYIRHPLAFLADSHFFFRESESTPEPTFKLMEWLNLVFPNVFLRSSDTGDLVADIGKLPDRDWINEPGSTSENEVQAKRSLPRRDANSILTEWRTQIRAAVITRKVNIKESEWTDRANKLIDWIREKADAGWSIEQFRSDINRRAMDSLSALYSSTFWISLWARLRRLPKQARGIPALRFEEQYKNAQDYCKRLIDTVRCNDDGSDQSEPIDLQIIYEVLKKDDPTHYHCHVVHALAYAIKGHWYATRTLCTVAIRIADNNPVENRGYIRGREAAYLLAIAERRMARSASDLETAREYLKEAKKRQNPDEPDDVRFDSEAFAQDTAEFNFHFFVQKQTAAVKELPESFFNTGLSILLSLDSESIPEVRDWVGQQVVTNLLDVCMAVHSLGSSQSSVIVDVIGKVLRSIEGSQRLRDTIVTDEVARFVYTASLAIFSTNAQVRKDANEKLAKLHFPSTRPYDALREALFKELASNVKQSPA